MANQRGVIMPIPDLTGCFECGLALFVAVAYTVFVAFVMGCPKEVRVSRFSGCCKHSDLESVAGGQMALVLSRSGMFHELSMFSASCRQIANHKPHYSW